jgi:hypothetical protein
MIQVWNTKVDDLHLICNNSIDFEQKLVLCAIGNQGIILINFKSSNLTKLK